MKPAAFFQSSARKTYKDLAAKGHSFHDRNPTVKNELPALHAYCQERLSTFSEDSLEGAGQTNGHLLYFAALALECRIENIMDTIRETLGDRGRRLHRSVRSEASARRSKKMVEFLSGLREESVVMHKVPREDGVPMMATFNISGFNFFLGRKLTSKVVSGHKSKRRDPEIFAPMAKALFEKDIGCVLTTSQDIEALFKMLEDCSVIGEGFSPSVRRASNGAATLTIMKDGKVKTIHITGNKEDLAIYRAANVMSTFSLRNGIMAPSNTLESAFMDTAEIAIVKNLCAMSDRGNPRAMNCKITESTGRISGSIEVEHVIAVSTIYEICSQMQYFDITPENVRSLIMQERNFTDKFTSISKLVLASLMTEAAVEGLRSKLGITGCGFDGSSIIFPSQEVEIDRNYSKALATKIKGLCLQHAIKRTPVATNEITDKVNSLRGQGAEASFQFTAGAARELKMVLSSITDVLFNHDCSFQEMYATFSYGGKSLVLQDFLQQDVDRAHAAHDRKMISLKIEQQSHKKLTAAARNAVSYEGARGFVEALSEVSTEAQKSLRASFAELESTINTFITRGPGEDLGSSFRSIAGRMDRFLTGLSIFQSTLIDAIETLPASENFAGLEKAVVTAMNNVFAPVNERVIGLCHRLDTATSKVASEVVGQRGHRADATFSSRTAAAAVPRTGERADRAAGGAAARGGVPPANRGGPTIEELSSSDEEGFGLGAREQASARRGVGRGAAVDRGGYYGR